jgi:hypothetical protein
MKGDLFYPFNKDNILDKRGLLSFNLKNVVLVK